MCLEWANQVIPRPGSDDAACTHVRTWFAVDHPSVKTSPTPWNTEPARVTAFFEP